MTRAVPAVEPNDLMPGDPDATLSAAFGRLPMCLTQCPQSCQLTRSPRALPDDAVLLAVEPK
ncbi:unnamed protein product [Staurois parvus]|uniref:Uncharacterized protein n=1 Tax=Staurois parvus TaxID=386267 RepID=A0ABN9FJ45_9NEOB|nr:unnamed protein product [Staurois parvus]